MQGEPLISCKYNNYTQYLQKQGLFQDKGQGQTQGQGWTYLSVTIQQWCGGLHRDNEDNPTDKNLEEKLGSPDNVRRVDGDNSTDEKPGRERWTTWEYKRDNEDNSREKNKEETVGPPGDGKEIISTTRGQ